MNKLLESIKNLFIGNAVMIKHDHYLLIESINGITTSNELLEVFDTDLTKQKKAIIKTVLQLPDGKRENISWLYDGYMFFNLEHDGLCYGDYLLIDAIQAFINRFKAHRLAGQSIGLPYKVRLTDIGNN